jgi:hypothetical protein
MPLKKDSPYYMKSSYESNFYGNENSITLEREFKVEGKDKDELRAAAPSIKGDVMP